jgi:hypothetical protein
MFGAAEARALTDRDDLGGRTFLPVSEDDPWTGWMVTPFSMNPVQLTFLLFLLAESGGGYSFSFSSRRRRRLWLLLSVLKSQ